MRRGSLFSDQRECWLCGNPNVHVHHVYGGVGRRPISEREGCWLYLCPFHHNMSNAGIHFDHELDARVKRECQERWMERNGKTEEEFCTMFGRSYL